MYFCHVSLLVCFFIVARSSCGLLWGNDFPSALNGAIVSEAAPSLFCCVLWESFPCKNELGLGPPTSTLQSLNYPKGVDKMLEAHVTTTREFRLFYFCNHWK